MTTLEKLQHRWQLKTGSPIPRSDFELMIDECQRDEELRERLIMCMSKLMRCLDKMSLVDDGK
jgi:hypothetical protein